MTKSFARQLALSTALLGVLATGTWAADPDPVTDELLFAAVFGVSVGAHDASDTKGDPDIKEGTAFTIAGEAAVSVPLGDTFSAQLDVQSEFYDRASEDEDDALGAHMIGGHLSWRDPGTGLLGLFAGAALPTINDAPDSDNGGIGFVGGVEAQYYIGNLTLYGQFGYGDIVVDNGGTSPEDEGFVDGWFGGLEARYFIHEDFMLNANVAYGSSADYDGNEKGEFWNWGVGGKMRLSDSMPIYGTADYRGGSYLSTNSDDEVTEHAFLVGLTFAFGATNLMENDRRGATLKSPMLPVRAAAWQESVD